MRLKEPLFGIRVAGLHPVIHFCFAINMMLFETNIYKNVKEDYEQSLATAKNIEFKKEYLRWDNFEPINFYERARRNLKESNLTTVLAGGGHDGHDIDHLSEPSWSVFYLFFAVHMLTAITNVSVYFLKKNQSENYSKKKSCVPIFLEWMQGFPLTFFYIILITYEIWRQKLLTPEKREEQLNDLLNVWFHQEIQFFVYWIISTSLFLLFVYLTKFKSIWQDNEQKQNLDSIWNMKNSMDALHYMSFEAYTFNLCMAAALQHLFGIIQYWPTVQLDKDASNPYQKYWREVVFSFLPCTLMTIVRFMMAFAFLNHIGQTKNTLFGQCPYTAWTIYLGITLTLYLSDAIWFYTRDNSVVHHKFYVLINADLIAIPIQLIYLIFVYDWSKKKKAQIEQLQQIMLEKREKLYEKRLGRIEGTFLSLHNDALIEKKIIPNTTNLEIEGDGSISAKNKFDIFENEYYKEAVADMREKYFSGHYICPQLHLLIVVALEELEKEHELELLIRAAEKVTEEEDIPDEVKTKLHKAKVNGIGMALNNIDDDSNSGSSGSGAVARQAAIKKGDGYEKAPEDQLSGVSAQRRGRATSFKKLLKKQTRKEKQEAYESLVVARQELMDKSEIHLHHGFTEMIIMMISNNRQQQSELSDELIGRYLVQYSCIAAIQMSMCVLMIANILTDGSPDYDYTLYVTSFYTVVFAKFICSGALHIMLYPEIANTMNLMKYINNHQEDFKHANLAFHIAHTSHIINLVAEFLNIYMLAYQHTVEHCIIHFVALEIIVEIPHLYMGSLIDDKMKERIFQNHSHLEVKNKGCDIKFSDRDIFSKLNRFIYICHRAMYVSVLFYFAPYITILVYFLFVAGGHFPEHH